MTTHSTAVGSPFRQPRAVWAVAFASEGSFTATLAVQTPCTLVLVHPESELEDAVVGASSAAG